MTVSLDTTTAVQEEVQYLLRDGQLIHAAGILNTRWEEFSALDVARSLGLHNVAWDCTGDDTPGSLELTVLYFRPTQAEIEERLRQVQGVEEVEIKIQV